MSQARPKRKATINKTYNDSFDGSIFEERPTRSAQSRKSNSISSDDSSSKPVDKRKQPSVSLKKTSDISSKSSIKPAIPYNWQPSPSIQDYFSHKLNLEDAYIDLKFQTLVCPNQEAISTLSNASSTTSKRRKSKELFTLNKGDYIYMISEPPGEPYYIGRIMGFKLKNNQHPSKSPSYPTDDLNEGIDDASKYQFQIQWFYRPRDISKSTSDSRLLYASMHTDTCPMSSFRGLVSVKHKQDIEDEFAAANNQPTTSSRAPKKNSTPPSSSTSALEVYCQQPNCFYFNKLFDRYMIKFYDILPTASLLEYVENEVNNSKNFLIALHKRFEFIFMEGPRTKSFINSLAATSPCNCEKCGQWCASQESVTCASCHKFYHMLCLDPPLLKKPSRGFSWSCAPCNKKHEIEYQSKRMLMLSHDNKSSNERELSVELSALNSEGLPIESSQESNIDDQNKNKTPNESGNDDESVETVLPKYETVAIDFLEKDSNLSLEERRLKEEWNMRYLGMHARLEDGVDLEDRSPYPRASTRLGAKHQATNIPEFYDHPIVYYDVDKPSNGPGPKKKMSKKKKNEEEEEIVKLHIPKEYKDIPPKEFPQWLQPRPKGYIERGVDDGEGITAKLLWAPSKEDEEDDFKKLDSYINQCSPIAEKLDILPTSPNFVDAILKYYMDNNGNMEKALSQSLKLTREILKEPTFTKEEVKKFEAGVKKNGSELYPTFKYVKSQPCSMIVRFYYLWKKTKNGRLIWGNYEGRMHKKLQNQIKEESKMDPKKDTKASNIDSLADPNDDSSYETEKVYESKKIFCCKHCHTNQSTQWFKITGYDTNTKLKKSKDKEENESFANNDVFGLCFRCAKLWRRYAVVWEDPNEVQKKNTKSVGGWKKKIEAELVNDAELILQKSEEDGQGLSYELPEITTSISGSIKRKASLNSTKSDTKKQKPVDSKKLSVSVKKDESAVARKKKSSTPIAKDSIKSKIESPTSSKPKIKKETTKTKQEPKSAVTVKKEADSGKGEETKKRKRAENNPGNGKDVKKMDTKRKDKVASNVSTSSKKQKKTQNSSPSLINIMLNQDYVLNLPSSLHKIDKKSIPTMNKDTLKEIISNYRAKVLTDINSQVQPYQCPSQAKIRNPFSPDERNCSVCLDYDTLESSIQEMLICSNCGVNVHASCVGISVPNNAKLPLKEWLCHACVNDLNPHHSTSYNCSLCLANDMNHELSFFGSPLVKPDYLRPIHDSGKWCHFICALFSHQQVVFKGISNPQSSTRKLTKEEITDQKTIIENTHNSMGIESVSEIYLKNYTCRCGICKSSNGSLISCDICESSTGNSEKYHVTCAQDTPNYKLGFRLIPQAGSGKDNLSVSIGMETGRLKPVLLCPKHDAVSSGVHHMRKAAKRITGSAKEGTKPLIQLFIEDIVKGLNNPNNNKLTGPQFKAHNYISMIRSFSEQEKLKNLAKQGISLLDHAQSRESEKKACVDCHATASPMWWPIQEDLTDTSDRVWLRCQTCHHKQENDDDDDENGFESEAQKLQEILHEPLSADNYHLQGENDHVSDIFKSSLLEQKPVRKDPEPQPHRSRISIGDILS